MLCSLGIPLQATSIRLPVESGTSRLRGFGYAEFGSITELMDALSLSGEVCVCPRHRWVNLTTPVIINDIPKL